MGVFPLIKVGIELCSLGSLVCGHCSEMSLASTTTCVRKKKAELHWCTDGDRKRGGAQTSACRQILSWAGARTCGAQSGGGGEATWSGMTWVLVLRNRELEHVTHLPPGPHFQ